VYPPPSPLVAPAGAPDWPRRSLEGSLAAAALTVDSPSLALTGVPQAPVMPPAATEHRGHLVAPTSGNTDSSADGTPATSSARATARQRLEGALREYTRALERAVEDSAEEEAAILMVDRLHRKLQRHDAETEALARLSSFAPPPQIRPAP